MATSIANQNPVPTDVEAASVAATPSIDAVEASAVPTEALPVAATQDASPSTAGTPKTASTPRRAKVAAEAGTKVAKKVGAKAVKKAGAKVVKKSGAKAVRKVVKKADATPATKTGAKSVTKSAIKTAAKTPAKSPVKTATKKRVAPGTKLAFVPPPVKAPAVAAPEAPKPASAPVQKQGKPKAKAVKPKSAEIKQKAPGKNAEKAVAGVKKAEVPKAKLVRDSFTMPKDDYALIAALKDRALKFKRPAKKSELLRAGLHALQALSAPALREALDALTPLKTGRPRKDAA
ncbi:hypothetical protein [Variovorax sp. dw_308]|uniref:hypothetical protein n=1 Tax=Variovorax sp. dw_308 TaxID=2721546 RepID=UPI00210E33DA|nr:hypothetical protein [Variovorax sp. dw_308]